METKQIIKRIKYWQQALFLQRWDLYLQMTKSRDSKVVTNSEYLYATIHLSEKVHDDDMDAVLCHEMLHILLDEELEQETLIEVLVGIIMKQHEQKPKPKKLQKITGKQHKHKPIIWRRRKK